MAKPVFEKLPYKALDFNITKQCCLLVVCFILMVAVSCKKDIEANKPKPLLQYTGYHEQAVGASAKDLLSRERFTSLTVEVNYMSGFRPEDETIVYLNNFLNQYLHKPDSIKIVLTEIEPDSLKQMSSKDLMVVEDKVRKHFTSEKNIAIHLLFTDGTNPNPAILGMAYRNTSVVLYGKNIDKHSTSKGKLTKAELETSVLLHEMGHLLGLVNKGSPIQQAHHDEQHQDHCENRACLMYWSTETKTLSLINRRGKIPQLDDDCVEDLRKNGAKSLASHAFHKLPF